MSAEITQEEAERLIKMVKQSLIDTIDFPSRGKTKEFDVIGDTKQDVFLISIYRGKIRPFKYNFGARIKKNGIMLMELHINETSVHCNPDGEKIKGNHWHVYRENYGREFAFPAEDLNSELFVDNTIMFLEKFNVVKQPQVIHQMEII